MVRELVDDKTSGAFLRVLAPRFAALFSIELISRASAFLLIPIYLNLMTQEEFGLFNYLLMLIQSMALVFNFGLYVPQSKYFHEMTSINQRNSLFKSIHITLGVALFGSLGVCYLFQLDIAFINYVIKGPIDIATFRYIFLAGIVISVYSLMVQNYLLTSEQIYRAQRFSFLRCILAHILAILALYMVVGDAASIRFEYAFLGEAIALVIMGRSYFQYFQSKYDLTIAIRCFKMGIPIMISALIGIGANFSDKFFLERYGSRSDMGVYAFAVIITSVIPVISVTLQNIWLPLFFKEKDFSLKNHRVKILAKTMILIFGFFSILTILAVKLMLEFNVVSSSYSAALDILPILLISQIFISLSGLYSNYVIQFEDTHLVIWISLIGSIVSVLASVLLIPTFNIIGAATTNLIVNAFFCGTYYLVYQRYRFVHSSRT